MKRFSFGLRRQNIFHKSEIPQDPEEIKLRFRRWMVVFSIFVALIITAIPIFKYRKPAFRSLADARIVANFLMETRANSNLKRSSTGLQLIGDNRWQQVQPSKNDCILNPSDRPEADLIQSNSAWRILFLPKYANDGIGRDVKYICFHPEQGVVADGEPIAEGWLYFLVSPVEDTESDKKDRSYQLVLSQYGDKLSIQPLL